MTPRSICQLTKQPIFEGDCVIGYMLVAVPTVPGKIVSGDPWTPISFGFAGFCSRHGLVDPATMIRSALNDVTRSVTGTTATESMRILSRPDLEIPVVRGGFRSPVKIVLIHAAAHADMMSDKLPELSAKDALEFLALFPQTFTSRDGELYGFAENLTVAASLIAEAPESFRSALRFFGASEDSKYCDHLLRRRAASRSDGYRNIGQPEKSAEIINAVARLERLTAAMMKAGVAWHVDVPGDGIVLLDAKSPPEKKIFRPPGGDISDVPFWPFDAPQNSPDARV